MGYSCDLFTDDVNKDFLCPICQDVLKDIVVLDPCDHAFCKVCITRWRTNSNTCPSDRRPIIALKPPQRMCVNLLNGLEMRCPFSDAGCTAEFKLGDFDFHDERCKYNPENHKPCTKKCGAILTRAEKRTHSCIDFLKQALREKEEELEEAQSSVAHKIRRSLKEKEAELKTVTQKLKSKESDIKVLENYIKMLEEQIQDLVGTKDAEIKECQKQIKALKRSSDARPGVSKKRKSAGAEDPSSEITCASCSNVNELIYDQIVRIVAAEVGNNYPKSPLDAFSFRDAIKDNLNMHVINMTLAPISRISTPIWRPSESDSDDDIETETPASPGEADKQWSVQISFKNSDRDEGFELLSRSAVSRVDLIVRDLKIIIWQ